MKTSSPQQIPLLISNCQFLVSPLSITSSLSGQTSSEGFYCFQIERGPQVVSRINQLVSFREQMCHLFKLQEQVNLRIFDQKSPGYSVSMYHSQFEEETFITSFSLPLLDLFQKYIRQLAKYSKEYLVILDRMSKNQVLGKRWQALKSILTQKQFITAKDQMSAFTLQFVVQIITDVDQYDRSHPELIRVRTKSSCASKKSLSSIESKEKRKHQTTLSSQGKSQLKSHAQSKLQTQLTPKPSTYLSTECQSQEKKKVFENQESRQEKTPVFLPLHSTLQKKNQILSDIIERSNEGQSNFLSGNTSDRKRGQLAQIQQQKMEALVKSKTQKYLPKGGDMLLKSKSLEEDRKYVEREMRLQNNDQNGKNEKKECPLLRQERKQSEAALKKSLMIVLLIMVGFLLVSLYGILNLDSKRRSTQRIRHSKIKKWSWK